MSDGENIADSQQSPENADQNLQQQIIKVLGLSGKLIEEKVKGELAKQAAAEKSATLIKGKPLSGFLDFISGFSTQASSINRSLALAGVAIIWLFKNPIDKPPIVPPLLDFPLICLVFSLGLDLLQYFFAAIAWRFFYEYKYSIWKKNNYDDAYAKDINAPNAISLPIDIIFFLKIAAMILAYVKIFSFLMTKI
jgi:hypothetical protein